MVPYLLIVEYLLKGSGSARLPAPIRLKIGTEELYTNVFQLAKYQGGYIKNELNFLRFFRFLKVSFNSPAGAKGLALRAPKG